ncbi:MAG: hypothetical protein IKB38_09675 [Clostridia bacterium]|nr:hypothetical protein [Clostridia bacterium]
MIFESDWFASEEELCARYGHSYGEWETVEEPDGLVFKRSCKTCGSKEQRVLDDPNEYDENGRCKNGHIFKYYNEGNHSYRECSFCGYAEEVSTPAG